MTVDTIQKDNAEIFHILSFGFLWIRPKNNHQTNYIESIYSLLEENSNFIDIYPSQNILKKWYNEGELVIYKSPIDDKSLFLNKFIKIKVVLPKRKITDMVRYANFWNPEEFFIFFNGQEFVTMANTNEYPTRTEVNKITEKLLLETIGNSDELEVVYDFDPSIIKTDLYLRSQSKSNLRGSSYKIVTQNGCVCIDYNENASIDSVVDRILTDSLYPLSSFFDQRIAAADYYEKVQIINKSNKLLTSLVTNYFSIPKRELLFSPKSREIRKLLAEMHTMMLDISTCEDVVRKTKKDAIESIERSNILSNFEVYFQNQMDSEIVFNRESQLNMMNFAFSEGNTFSTTQATIPPVSD